MSQTIAPAPAPAVAAPAPAVAAPAAPATPAPAQPTSLLSEPPATPAPATTEPPATDPAAQVPEKYDLKLPEGTQIDTALATAYETAAREAGLTQAQVEKLTPALVKELQGLRDAPMAAWSDLNKQWVDAVKADPDIGGARLPATLADASRAVEAFGGEALKQALAATGAGNNPAVVRAFAAIGRAMGSDSTAPQPAKVAQPPVENTLGAIASRLYPSMTP